MQTKSNTQEPERAVLVGVEIGREGAWEVEDSLEELSQLADTAGAQVVGQLIGKLSKINPATFIGSGKTQELASLCQGKQAEVIIFDDDLAPAQIRNLQEICQVRVIDRTQVILDIFSRRARTKEAKLQIELAQLQYLLPRLTHQWLHLSRQEGGIGMRGPGETQLEVDRRRVKTKILKLNKELEGVETERGVQRKRREKKDISTIAVIGYTNAGKSTLFNRLTSSSNLVEDRLFATLDSSVRKVQLPGYLPVLFSDTVGFIRKLPHHLVESFKTTLEEVVHADLLIHVVDCHDHLVDEKYEVVLSVLKELEADKIPRILALNKIDLLESSEILTRWMRKDSSAVPVSAKQGQGMDSLMSKVIQFLQERFKRLSLFIPHQETEFVALLHREAHILEKKFDEKGVWLEVEVPNYLILKVKPFTI